MTLSICPSVSIIVLNWNGFEITKECLESLRRVSYPNFGVVLVDNGSDDGSGRKLVELFPWITLVENEKNLGFAAGNNAGIRFVLDRNPDYILLLNNDTIVSKDFLSLMIRAAEADPLIGVLNPKIYYLNPPEMIWYGGGTFSLWKGLPSHKGHRQLDRGQFNQGGEVSFVTGCALLMRSSVVKRVGLLDEIFFMISEDTDLSIRILQAGFKAAYVPAAIIWHNESYTTKRRLGKSYRDYYNVRNSILIARKHARFYHWPTFLFFLASMLTYRTGGYLLRREFTRIQALYRGVWAGWRVPLCLLHKKLS